VTQKAYQPRVMPGVIDVTTWENTGPLCGTDPALVIVGQSTQPALHCIALDTATHFPVESLQLPKAGMK
jgi:hypothetical protein